MHRAAIRLLAKLTVSWFWIGTQIAAQPSRSPFVATPEVELDSCQERWGDGYCGVSPLVAREAPDLRLCNLTREAAIEGGAKDHHFVRTYRAREILHCFCTMK